MLKITKPLLLFFFVPIYVLAEQSKSIQQNNSSQDRFQIGQELNNNGDWQGALKVWWTNRYELDRQNKVDPRIGIAFIELATEKKAQIYYGNASELYLWGFSKKLPDKYKNTVEEEVERILPLLNETEQIKWRFALKQQNQDICQFIRLFWIEKDSRPLTRGNERLIEHWERIAFARKHLNKNRNGVYNCDDRGTIYVKYGYPTRKHTGSLGAASGEVELFRWVLNRTARRNIKINDLKPDYELWIYNTLGTWEHSVFLFSRRFGTGSFGLVEGIESIIPRDKSIYQIMYYAELSLFDPYYRNRYFELEDIWTQQQIAQEQGQPSEHYSRMLRGVFNSNKSNDRINPNYKYAKLDKSDYEDKFGTINVITRNVRLLDENNQPQLAVITFCFPKLKPIVVETDTGKFLTIADYQLRNTLIIRDESLHEIGRVEDIVQKGMDNVSVFKVNHFQSNNHFSISSEALGEISDSMNVVYSSGVQKKLLAIGKTFFKASKPLTVDFDSLELSDLVLGVKLPNEKYKSYLLFPLIPANQIVKEDPLQVFCEIYHLRRDESGTTHYTLEFGITKLGKDGKVDKKAEKISMVYNYDTPDQSRREHFSIDLTKLKPGLYELFSKVTDKVSGQEKIRKEKITILI